MAMIKCHECGREISDSADRCPHCGRASKKHEMDLALIALVIGSIPFDIGGIILLLVGINKYNEAYFSSQQDSARLMIILGIV